MLIHRSIQERSRRGKPIGGTSRAKGNRCATFIAAYDVSQHTTNSLHVEIDGREFHSHTPKLNSGQRQATRTLPMRNRRFRRIGVPPLSTLDTTSLVPRSVVPKIVVHRDQQPSSDRPQLPYLKVVEREPATV